MEPLSANCAVQTVKQGDVAFAYVGTKEGVLDALQGRDTCSGREVMWQARVCLEL